MGNPKIVASLLPRGDKADLQLTLFGVPPVPVNWLIPNLDAAYAALLAEAINAVDPDKA
jgi:hypothetical protein